MLPNWRERYVQEEECIEKKLTWPAVSHNCRRIGLLSTVTTTENKQTTSWGFYQQASSKAEVLPTLDNKGDDLNDVS